MGSCPPSVLSVSSLLCECRSSLIKPTNVSLSPPPCVFNLCLPSLLCQIVSSVPVRVPAIVPWVSSCCQFYNRPPALDLILIKTCIKLHLPRPPTLLLWVQPFIHSLHEVLPLTPLHLSSMKTLSPAMLPITTITHLKFLYWCLWPHLHKHRTRDSHQQIVSVLLWVWKSTISPTECAQWEKKHSYHFEFKDGEGGACPAPLY